MNTTNTTTTADNPALGLGDYGGWTAAIVAIVTGLVSVFFFFFPWSMYKAHCARLREFNLIVQVLRDGLAPIVKVVEWSTWHDNPFSFEFHLHLCHIGIRKNKRELAKVFATRVLAYNQWRRAHQDWLGALLSDDASRIRLLGLVEAIDDLIRPFKEDLDSDAKVRIERISSDTDLSGCIPIEGENYVLAFSEKFWSMLDHKPLGREPLQATSAMFESILRGDVEQGEADGIDHYAFCDVLDRLDRWRALYLCPYWRQLLAELRIWPVSKEWELAAAHALCERDHKTGKHVIAMAPYLRSGFSHDIVPPHVVAHASPRRYAQMQSFRRGRDCISSGWPTRGSGGALRHYWQTFSDQRAPGLARGFDTMVFLVAAVRFLQSQPKYDGDVPVWRTSDPSSPVKDFIKAIYAEDMEDIARWIVQLHLRYPHSSYFRELRIELHVWCYPHILDAARLVERASKGGGTILSKLQEADLQRVLTTAETYQKATEDPALCRQLYCKAATTAHLSGAAYGTERGNGVSRLRSLKALVGFITGRPL